MDTPPEDTMSPVETEDNLIENDLSAVQSGSNVIDKSLLQVVNLDDHNTIYVPTCLVCTSTYRKEIESTFLENKKHDAVRDFCKSRGAPYLSNEVIDNHMRFHYEKGIGALKQIEFIDRIRRLSSVETTTLGRLRFMMDAITDQIVQLQGMTPSGDLSATDIEKIKSQEINKLSQSMGRLLKLHAEMMGEMKDNGELLTIPKQAFVNFFNAAITNANDEKEREVIKDILSQLASLSNV
jgi:methyl-accepting chemotaxis protein